jgi:DNA-binding transcriptional MerR regulator
MNNYSVHNLAKLAGVTARTLRHYDAIGLLKPRQRESNGHRVYGREELLRLQQILFYKELDFDLESIKKILDEPDFDIKQALSVHKKMLNQRSLRIKKLVETIDKTIIYINNKEMVTDEELYEGFSKELAEQYAKEAKDKWPETYDESINNLKMKSKKEWEDLKQEGDSITKELVNLMDKEPSDSEVQKLIEKHFNWMTNFWTPNKESYKGLATSYVEDERFKKSYDKYAVGLASFLEKAMHIYADENLE